MNLASFNNFSTGMVGLVVVVLVVLELPPLSAPPSVGLSNLVHMKYNLHTCLSMLQLY